MEQKYYITEDEISERIENLADSIHIDYEHDSKVVLVGVLKGCIHFLSDLSRKLCRHFSSIEFAFIRVSSYKGEVRYGKDRQIIVMDNNDVSIEGKVVIIVDDILDTGRTMKELVTLYSARNPKSVATCVLLDKKDVREVPIDPDYVGFTVPNLFYIGYGLDYHEKKREVPYIVGVPYQIIDLD